MDDKLAKAKRVIEELFSDTSVSQEDTLTALEELQEDLQIKINMLYNDIYANAS